MKPKIFRIVFLPFILLIINLGNDWNCIPLYSDSDDNKNVQLNEQNTKAQNLSIAFVSDPNGIGIYEKPNLFCFYISKNYVT